MTVDPWALFQQSVHDYTERTLVRIIAEAHKDGNQRAEDIARLELTFRRQSRVEQQS